MSDFIKFFIEDMGKEVLELTCAAIVNILKYIPGVQGVDEAVHLRPYSVVLIPDQLKTQKMCEKSIEDDPRSLACVPDLFKTQEMCNEAVSRDAYTLDNVPDYIMTQEMCNEAVEEDPYVLNLVPNRFRTKKMCLRWTPMKVPKKRSLR